MHFLLTTQIFLSIILAINYSLCKASNNHTNSVIRFSRNLTEIEPVFRLFLNKTSYTDISFADRDLNDLLAHLVNYDRVIFITHGFRGTVNKPWMHELKNAIIDELRDQAVIIIGWGNGAMAGTFPSYTKYQMSIENIELVANWLSFYIRKIATQYPKLKLWGIGHSLGAHLMGQTGRLTKAFARITALDPAGPTFMDGEQNYQKRLKPTDAKIVDVIHTNGHNYRSIYYRIFGYSSNPFGTLLPLGTVDFYPNYGHTQPGCSSTRCNHNRAIELFVWSVTNRAKLITNKILKLNSDYKTPLNQYFASNVSIEMGFYYDTRARAHGDYYIATNDREPWI